MRWGLSRILNSMTTVRRRRLPGTAQRQRHVPSLPGRSDVRWGAPASLHPIEGPTVRSSAGLDEYGTNGRFTLEPERNRSADRGCRVFREGLDATSGSRARRGVGVVRPRPGRGAAGIRRWVSGC